MAVTKEFREHCIAYNVHWISQLTKQIEDAYWDGDEPLALELRAKRKKLKQALETMNG